MKIMFDSNVWQKVVCPDDYKSDVDYIYYENINKAIKDDKIKPYLSETIFTIEAIRKVERQDFWGNYKPEFNTQIEDCGNGNINIKITIAPPEGLDFKDRPILYRYFNMAKSLNFRIVRFPRVALIGNKEIESILYKDGIDNELSYEIANKIEQHEAGFYYIQKLGKQYDENDWMHGLKSMPVTDRKKVAKATAEWADGDSVVMSIITKCDYFCSNDRAKGAGNKSILSSQNLEWLNQDYGFKVITPRQLCEIL